MNNYNWILPSLLISAMTVTLLPVLPNQVSHAEKRPAQPSFSWWNLFRRNPPVGRGKGAPRPIINGVCIAAPDRGEIIWSDRPFIIWQGNLKKIGLSQGIPDASATDNIQIGQLYATYTGNPLLPAQQYHWSVAIENSWAGNIAFKIMEPQQKQRITNDLQQLEQQEKAKGVTAEGIAFAKAKYFLEQDPPLRSDALQQAYSVDKPSPELVKIREEIVKDFCKPN
ncbi:MULTISPECIES: hypothetical protein [unclassified Tolypothrix]|uniref:hypothetical protein n=1 Tax=unclassified Tolypothrix TaxID=2649714 RepID=UPI0005EAB09C|nr:MULTISPECIES: hypothetical protein [unclassified Tolypothrix]BAY93679.1 hypothetical protein NIES3275_57210 [Microchaete diplosiphon NIES-3275]EKE96641.1 hypothetical protein FDUTEX481_06474 [Tolypothrix sp. PCC 7601]MBE9086071.1 hypothetical protein [Tolypothrix sp. LEGE 11397]UYD27500.1 hypothetical protein HGR01_05265 [Tolypothrix sp. PCC 7712]UYD36637.1 hypothetical protein HG267_13445 [Tolypothrix sp. PCC 7601]